MGFSDYLYEYVNLDIAVLIGIFSICESPGSPTSHSSSGLENTRNNGWNHDTLQWNSPLKPVITGEENPI